ncbi:MAG: hypothetical protein ACXACA_05835, partial [Candidatus Ranarchaeia archaeon]
MESKKNSRIPLLFLALSVMGLSLLPFIVSSPNIPFSEFPFRTQIIGSLFITLCILGILAGLFPNQCQRGGPQSPVEEYSQDKGESTKTPIRFSRQGHHPACEHFSSHTLRIRNRVYCAGCTGLVLGALFAISGSVLYFIFGIFFGDPFFGFWVGVFGSALGILQHPLYIIFNIKQGFIRTLTNTIFVGSAFLLLTSMDLILRNFEIGLYTLA